MAIELQCTCGKRYRVADEIAGKAIRCKQCSEVIRVPMDDVIDIPPSAVRPVVTKPRDVMPGDKRPPARPAPEKPRPKRPLRAVAPDAKMQQELDAMRRKSNSAASNPGLLRVNYLKWIRAFPKWVFIWHGCCLACFLLLFVSWKALIPACMLLAAVGLYWQKVKTHFIAGCINPAMVLSINTPLVAVTTDLTKGDGDFDVIRILRQPLANMSTGLPKPGQLVATVSLYENLEEEQAHWSNFNPVIADIVTTDQRHIDRILNSIEDEDWDLLADGMQQVGDWRDEGLYRIFKPDYQPDVQCKEEILMIVQEELAGQDDNGVHIGHPQIIPADLRTNAIKAYARDVNPRDVLALAPSRSTPEQGRVGLMISTQGIHYGYPECKAGKIPWDCVLGVFLSEGTFEIVADGDYRIRIPAKHFRYKTAVKLESAINQMIGH